MVHCCQEFINPGQCAPIALQITNLGKYPVELDMRFPICQLVLFKLSSPSSKYRDEVVPMQSKIYEDDEKKDEPVSIENCDDNKNVKDKKTKRFLKKYISPLLPSIIMLLLITPFLQNIEGITIHSFLSSVKNLPIVGIFALIAVIAYIYFRKDDE